MAGSYPPTTRDGWVGYFDEAAGRFTGQPLPPRSGASWAGVLRACWRSFHLANGFRNSGDPHGGDEAVAEAEHYLFARAVSYLLPPLTTAPALIMTVGYDAVKRFAYLAGGDEALQIVGKVSNPFGQGRTTRASPGQIQAGLDGAADGYSMAQLVGD